MKKIFIILLVFGTITFGIYLAFPKKKMSTAVRFFSIDKIQPSDVRVNITDNGFDPPEVEVKQNQRLVFVNQTSGFAWPASDPHPTHTNYPGFDPEEPMRTNEVWAFVFEKTGVWKYHDHLHPSRRAQVTVD